MPEKKTNNAESEFHRRRKAFVILPCGILIAPDGFAGSHFDLLCQSGFTAEQTRKTIELRPRGYALDGSVYLYQGGDFFRLSDGNEREAKKWFPFFITNGWLKPDGKIYSGMQRGEKGTVWRPVKEFEISF